MLGQPNGARKSDTKSGVEIVSADLIQPSVSLNSSSARLSCLKRCRVAADALPMFVISISGAPPLGDASTTSKSASRNAK